MARLSRLAAVGAIAVGALLSASACGSERDTPANQENDDGGEGATSSGGSSRSGGAAGRQPGGTSGGGTSSGSGTSSGGESGGGGTSSGGESGGGTSSGGESGGLSGGGDFGGSAGGGGAPDGSNLEDIVDDGVASVATVPRSAFGAVLVVNDGERVYAVESRRDVEPGPFGLPWRSSFRLAAYDDGVEAWTFAAEKDDVVSDVAVHPLGDVTIAGKAA